MVNNLILITVKVYNKGHTIKCQVEDKSMCAIVVWEGFTEDEGVWRIMEIR